jgi:hypothetical protein
MITPSQFLRDTEERRQAVLAEAARAHLVTSATRPSRSVAPRPADRIRAGLRHAVAALVIVASLIAFAFVA